MDSDDTVTVRTTGRMRVEDSSGRLRTVLLDNIQVDGLSIENRVQSATETDTLVDGLAELAERNDCTEALIIRLLDI